MKLAQYQFPALQAISGLRHSFLLRQAGVVVDVDREQALANLSPHFRAGVADLGVDPAEVATCEQVHGGSVLYVGEPQGIDRPLPGADGLITDRSGLLLGIYVADCCAVYIVDRHLRAAALVHSGKKGTEAGIAASAIRRMAEFGVEPADLEVQLSPCIRPPVYEIDFAAQIRADCAAAGVPSEQIHDDGTCTSEDPERFYSYRLERGKTGRMLALLGIEGRS